MTWTTDGWEAFCALVEEAWPGEFDDRQSEAWRVLLDPVDPEAAGAALLRLAHSGRTFYPRPAVSDLLAELRSDPGRPAFEEMLLLVGTVLAARPPYPGRMITAEEETRARATRLLELHPMVQSFVARQGLQRLGSLPLADEEWGEKHRRDLQERWEQHLETHDGREIAVLASGGRTDLRQLDPLASLGVSAKPQLEAGPLTSSPEKETTSA